MKDHYRVKFMFSGEWHFGTVRYIDKTSKDKKPKRGHVYVDDAVKPVFYEIKESDLIDIPLEHDPMKEDEYDKYAKGEYNKALKLAKETPDKGVHVGSMFQIGVGDGYAVYVVKKVGRLGCVVEWLGDGGDNWMDHRFGIGGTFPISEVKRYVESWKSSFRIFREK